MFRVAANRRVVGTAVAVVAAAAVGLGAYSLGSTVEAATPQTLAAQETAAIPRPAEERGTAEPAASSPLTLEEAQAVAARAASAPGRVIEWDEDDEPTGLRYDVTLLHDDGTTTDVEVDTVTGQVTSVDHDTDRD
jgi:uncharacterized membrane protein YkoI